MTTPAAALENALELIRHGGLIKRLLYDGRGGHCSVGALLVANPCQRMFLGNLDPSNDTDVIALSCLVEVITAQYPDRVVGRGIWHPTTHTEFWDNQSRLVTFNNHADTTQAEVEAVFEKAIDQAWDLALT